MLYEVFIHFQDHDNVKSYVIIELLKELGVDVSKIVQTRSGKTSGISFYSDKKSEIILYEKKIKSLHLKGVKVKVSKLKDEDWKSKWTRDYRPFKINKDFRVVPYRLKDKYKLNKTKDILIRTDIIFGSGLHETTRFMSEFIAYRKKSLGRFLDVGTGTGLLSIIADHYGAGQIHCFDIDAEAVSNAGFNFKINDVHVDSLKVSDLNTFSSRHKFDFVAANLLTRDLLKMKTKLVKLLAPYGYLAVSGISLEHYAEFRMKFDIKSLRCIRIKKGKDWTGILYKRIN